MNEIELTTKAIIKKIDLLKTRVESLGQGKSTLLNIAHESFVLGSESHLNSLNPEIREELGLELIGLTQQNSVLQASYIHKKNKYLSLGKSYAAVNFLFDLLDESFTELDLILLQEILIGEGNLRREEVFIERSDKSRVVFASKDLLQKIKEVFFWFEAVSKEESISKVVIAILFHYKIVSIHPFQDGNGRIARLAMNLIMLKHGLFPVTIPNDRRKEYYDSLVLADQGNFHALVDYMGELVLDKLERYMIIAKELDDLDFNKNFLVLTEDGNTNMIKNLIEIHGIDLNRTKIESYDGKDNLASAIFFAKKLTSKTSNLKHILIHIDRDNDNPQNLRQKIERYLKGHGIDAKSTILITQYYDIESYFLNERHINSLHPNITADRARELIEEATEFTAASSKAKLRIAYSSYGKFGKMEDPLLKAQAIDQLYDEDPLKFRYGKNVLYKLEELIGKELGLADRVTLTKYSDHLKIREIERSKYELEKE